jgi:NADPH-dependent 2,4-dienoyl-CoA reductase/sulfur reductase-like enzyme
LKSTQILFKSQGVIPEGRVLIAGTGPLLYLAAAQFFKNGADVMEVIEASSFSDWIKNSAALWRSPDLLGKGVRYLAGLKSGRVPIYFGTVVKEALGNTSLEEVEICRVDKNWSRISGTERRLKADVLCMNFGFIPSTSFSHLAKCRHVCDLNFRGWKPLCTSKYETSQDGVFVAGDSTGIGGVKLAVTEGRIVGTEVARQLGCLSESEANDHFSRLNKTLARQNWYHDFLKKIYHYRAGLMNLLTDETVVCRCEEVKVKAINQILDGGFHHIEAIKRLTRLGMGRCQGRFCYPTLLGMLAQRHSFDEIISEDFSGRPPVKPLPLGLFSEMASYEI